MWVIVLTLIAAALSALSAAGEQRSASRLAGTVQRKQRGEQHPVSVRSRPAVRSRRETHRRFGYGLGLAAALLTSPLWLSSWALDAGGFFTQAAALHVGSLSAVQPLMVTTLLFGLPLAALGTGHRPGLGGWAGAAMICAGLVLVLSTRALPATGTTHYAPLLAAMSIVVLIAATLVVLGRGRTPSLRAGLLSVAAGALFAVGAAITKLTATTFAVTGLTGLLTSWSGYALAVVSLTSFSLQQAAYASGPLAPAITATVISDPLVSYVLGVTGFGETPPHTGSTLLLVASGMLTLGLGVALLARSPLLARPARPAGAEKVAAGDAGNLAPDDPGRSSQPHRSVSPVADRPGERSQGEGPPTGRVRAVACPRSAVRNSLDLDRKKPSRSARLGKSSTSRHSSEH